MAESAVHRSMKDMVRRELEGERYTVIEEPLYPPGDRMSWDSYRPDLLGFRRESGREEVALVECETHPAMKRFSSKRFDSVWFQPGLYYTGSVRRILAVPQGRLKAVDMRLRKEWEIWVVGRETPLSKASVMLPSRTVSQD